MAITLAASIVMRAASMPETIRLKIMSRSMG
jgi:hypothetical protein